MARPLRRSSSPCKPERMRASIANAERTDSSRTAWVRTCMRPEVSPVTSSTAPPTARSWDAKSTLTFDERAEQAETTHDEHEVEHRHQLEVVAELGNRSACE